MDRESFSSSATETEKFIIAISVVFGVLIIGAAVAGAVWYCKMLKKDERWVKHSSCELRHCESAQNTWVPHSRHSGILGFATKVSSFEIIRV